MSEVIRLFVVRQNVGDYTELQVYVLGSRGAFGSYYGSEACMSAVVAAKRSKAAFSLSMDWEPFLGI